MIVKSFEIEKLKIVNQKFFLFYGENEGLKNQTIQNLFKEKLNENIYRYDEKEILDDKNNFIESISTKSFFDNERLIIISRTTDKIINFIEEVIEKNIEDLILILNSDVLEKKSKLRSLFEKNKQTVCVPFYADNSQTLSGIVNNFFREKKIPISQELINLLVSRSRGDRQNIKNELSKIENYTKSKKNISLESILKITNLAENYNVGELIDSLLNKNIKKTSNILNENNYSTEDCMLIIRTLLIKSKRLLKLYKLINKGNNIDQVISLYKPPIFWKDKEVVKNQIKNWSLEAVENLIYDTNEIELLVKKNSINSLNILSDFIMLKSNKLNN